MTNDRYLGNPDRWRDWDGDRWRTYNRQTVNIWTNRVNVNYNFYGYPAWATSYGWYYNRPWVYGWYGGWSVPPWGWWYGQSAVWGIAELAAALIINSAINDAIAARQTWIVVPSTDWRLYYGSIQAYDPGMVSFTVSDGVDTYDMVADCADGLLNSYVPTSPAEAQLVNTACQVAYGDVG